jgi:TfoX/Sxy family transcriptional regulator of competence genes
MKMVKSPQALVDRFAKAVEGFASAEKKQMFGYPSIFVNGNLTAGLFADGCMIRIPDAERAAAKVTPFEPMPGRPMKDYGLLPPAVVDDPAQLKVWIGKAIAWAEELPPKVKKAKPAAKKPKKK